MSKLLLLSTTFGLMVFLAATGISAAGGKDDSLIALPKRPGTITVLKNGETYLDLGFVGWGPDWAWMGFKRQQRVKDGHSLTTLTSTVRSSSAGSAQVKLVTFVAKATSTSRAS